MTQARLRRSMLWLAPPVLALLGLTLPATPTSAAGSTAAVSPVLPKRPYLVHVGDHAFFAARDAEHGFELWTSDGTPRGTRMVKDIRKNGSSNPGVNINRFRVGDIAAVGERVFFIADDGRHGQELWVSDGTRSGTHLVRDIMPGRASSEVDEMTAVGKRLYFVLVGKQHSHLWQTDGSAAHTKRVTSSGGDPVDPHTLYAWHGQLFFVAQGRDVGDELWKSGGTPGTTTLVKNIRPEPLNSRIQSFAGGDTRLYFVANDGAREGYGNFGIWRTDGTRRGTKYVRNVDPTRYLWDETPLPQYLTTMGDQLLFADQDCTHGWEPWSSDGTFDGTVLIDLQPGTNPGDCGPGSDPGPFAVYQDVAYFTATVDQQPALWRTDGTPDGTERVLDVTTKYSGPVVAAGALFVWESPDLDHCSLLAGDGTATGMTEIHDFSPQGDPCPDGGVPTRHIFFLAVDRTLWTSDGTSSGTGPVMSP